MVIVGSLLSWSLSESVARSGSTLAVFMERVRVRVNEQLGREDEMRCCKRQREMKQMEEVCQASSEGGKQRVPGTCSGLCCMDHTNRATVRPAGHPRGVGVDGWGKTLTQSGALTSHSRSRCGDHFGLLETTQPRARFPLRLLFILYLLYYCMWMSCV
jgi:hypothetical protein